MSIFHFRQITSLIYRKICKKKHCLLSINLKFLSRLMFYARRNSSLIVPYKCKYVLSPEYKNFISLIVDISSHRIPSQFSWYIALYFVVFHWGIKKKLWNHRRDPCAPENVIDNFFSCLFSSFIKLIDDTRFLEEEKKFIHLSAFSLPLSILFFAVCQIEFLRKSRKNLGVTHGLLTNFGARSKSYHPVFTYLTTSHLKVEHGFQGLISLFSRKLGASSFKDIIFFFRRFMYIRYLASKLRTRDWSTEKLWIERIFFFLMIAAILILEGKPCKNSCIMFVVFNAPQPITTGKWYGEGKESFISIGDEGA